MATGVEIDGAACTNADELKKLVFRRGQLKASLTRFSKYLSNTTGLDITGLKLRLTNINSVWAEFQALQAKIEEFDISQEPEGISFEEEYFQLAATAVNIIENAHSVAQTPSSSTDIHSNRQNTNIAKLQPISLPQFSGSYEQWLQFYEIFNALIHNNPELTKIQKFYYLHSSLTGEAIHVLHSLEICEANYDIAIELLKERYENKRVLIHNHVKNIFEMPCIQKESFFSLRDLIDNVTRNIRSLSSLNQPVNHWDTLLIYLISQKLDNHTRKEWEIFNKDDTPTLEEFLKFLKNKCQVLETINSKNSTLNHSNSHNRHSKSPVVHVSTNSQFNAEQKPSHEFSSNIGRQTHLQNNFQCFFCKQKTHFTYKCPKLMSFSCKERYSELKRLNICTNCLKPGHTNEVCTGKNCRICDRKHNSVLHDFNYRHNSSSHNLPNIQRNPISNIRNSNNNCHCILESNRMTSSQTVQPGNIATADSGPNETIDIQVAPTATLAGTTGMVPSENNKDSMTQVLLATAVIHIIDANNRPIKCRALLDSGSQSNFCTKQLHDLLGLPSNKVNMPVLGISRVACNISLKLKAEIRSMNNCFQTSVDFLVIDKLIAKLPQVSFDPCLLNIPNNIELADPQFYDTHDIDVLLGSEIFFRCLIDGRITLGSKTPILQNTRFGWVLAGSLPINFSKLHERDNQYSQQCFLSINDSSDSYKILHKTIQKFWQVENIANKQNKLTNEELECEIDFRDNAKTDSSGRYVVKLPLKKNYLELGESYQIAFKCLIALERRLNKNPELQQQYSNFLSEYEQLGHMSRIDPNNDNPNELCVYLSHHAVLKESSSTTKLRVVFNASLKTTSGLSLNDVLKIGPKVQRDVFDIVLSMRMKPIVIVADIEKMYRMVLIDESQRKFQRILWRDENTKEIIHYELNTITYGTASASFLATRVLHDIGQKFKDINPEVSQIILNNFYMDDLIFTHHNVDDAIRLRNEISEILKKSGFSLRKWMSNNNQAINAVNEPKDQADQFFIQSEPETKTLGTFWNPNTDTIGYKFNIAMNISVITKRTILSSIGKLFDILGLISPIIVCAKLILQEVWKLQLDWDTVVPANIVHRWLDFVEKLKYLNTFNIPRCVNSSTDSIVLCGFCDASKLAYGACLYVISKNDRGEITSHLLCSKSRLAPLSSMVLPRLELCGALLLAQLLERVVPSLEVNITEIVLFSDSTIVLDWLNAEPSKWEVFVSNRVAEIQRLTENISWYHIRSEDNPADIVSRGSDPFVLKNDSLWWFGPTFLKSERENWPKTHTVKMRLHDSRKTNLNISYNVLQTNHASQNEIFFKWSSYNKLVRVLTYVFRYANVARNKKSITIGPITSQEIDDTVLKLCAIVQNERFSIEFKRLKSNLNLNTDSKIINLNPFIDKKSNLLRVGGRLTHAELTFEQKHQIILPPKHKFVELLIKHYHLKFLHAGPQFILNELRNKFWIVNGRNEVRKVLNKCLTCFRIKPTSLNQIMGSLPKERVVPSRPFHSCGVDYAGPYLLKDGKTRNRVLIKGYICIFICLSTRAVHAELVTDLSAEAFLNAFKRFASRRGLCRNIFSDNGSNFIGANNELSRLCQIAQETVTNKYQSYFAENNIFWHFIPPRSPHHGGIWESAVRSFKYHLKRVLGDVALNFEHFYTLLVQIEAILNSRPISLLTQDSSDMEALTPAHFLIGSSLVAVPQRNDLEVPQNRLRYYRQLQQMAQRFWSLWSKDYLNSLQQRSKWLLKRENIKNNTIVLLKEDNEPPMNWPLGRIVALHPGRDNLVRVVSVRTKGGIVQRAITKVCPLPIEYE